MDKFEVVNGVLAFNKESTCASPSFTYIVGNDLGLQNFYDKTELRKTDSYWIDISVKSTSNKATFAADSLKVKIIDAAGGTLHTSIVDRLQAFSKGLGSYLEKIGEKYDFDLISNLGEKLQDTAKKI